MTDRCMVRETDGQNCYISITHQLMRDKNMELVVMMVDSWNFVGFNFS